jgi:hypothetical protein
MEFTSRAILLVQWKAIYLGRRSPKQFKNKFESIHLLLNTNLPSPPQQKTETIEIRGSERL